MTCNMVKMPLSTLRHLPVSRSIFSIAAQLYQIEGQEDMTCMPYTSGTARPELFRVP